MPPHNYEKFTVQSSHSLSLSCFLHFHFRLSILTFHENLFKIHVNIFNAFFLLFLLSVVDVLWICAEFTHSNLSPISGLVDFLFLFRKLFPNTTVSEVEDCRGKKMLGEKWRWKTSPLHSFKHEIWELFSFNFHTQRNLECGNSHYDFRVLKFFVCENCLHIFRIFRTKKYLQQCVAESNLITWKKNLKFSPSFVLVCSHFQHWLEQTHWISENSEWYWRVKLNFNFLFLFSFTFTTPVPS